MSQTKEFRDLENGPDFSLDLKLDRTLPIAILYSLYIAGILTSKMNVMLWRMRDSLSHVSQKSDSLQNQGVSQISPLF